MQDFPLRPTRLVAATDANIDLAASTLRAGGLVAMPTETVYGLAGLATSDAAVASIYAAKGRPSFNPLIAHFSSLEDAAREARLDMRAQRLAEAFWPGPLTIVAPVAANGSVGLLARAGLDTLGLRVPGHAVARALISAVGAPLAAPSANRSGRVSPTLAQHVRDDLDGRVDWILDAGPCPLGVESTIVACLGGALRLLRPGAIPAEAIEAAAGERLQAAGPEAGAAPMAPGALASHYAPAAPVRLEAFELRKGEAALDFAGALQDGAAGRLDLSPAGNLAEAAANLFAFLRRLDALRPAGIAVAPIPETGLGAAINDRLRRAAAPRQYVSTS